MATAATPYPAPERANVPSAAVRLPAVRDYEQVDREISATLRPSLAWFTALGIAIMSYDGRLGFGLLGDYDALPDLDAVAEDLERSIDELAEAAGASDGAPRPQRKPRKRAAAT